MRVIPAFKSEFHWRNGDPAGAFLGLVGAIVGFVIMPLCLCALVVGIGEASIRSGSPFMDPDQIRSLAGDYWYYTRRFISLAGPLVIVSIPMGLYRKGSYARVPFSLFYGLYLALLFLVFFQNGEMTAKVDGAGGTGLLTIESVGLTVNFAAIIYLAVIISVAKAFLAFAELAAHRKEYLEWLVERDEDREKKAEDREADEAEERSTEETFEEDAEEIPS